MNNFSSFENKKTGMLNTIKKDIFVPHKDCKRSKILENIQTSMKGKCDEKYGFIYDITSLRIIDNEICDTGIKVTCEIDCMSICPKEGDVVEGIITDIEDDYITVSGKGNLNINVDTSNCSKRLHIDSKINVKLVRVKFDHGCFSCIGEIC